MVALILKTSTGFSLYLARMDFVNVQDNYPLYKTLVPNKAFFVPFLHRSRTRNWSIARKLSDFGRCSSEATVACGGDLALRREFRGVIILEASP